MTKARHAAEAFTYDGLHDRLSGLFVGARLFATEVRQGSAEKDAELRERLALVPNTAETTPALETTTLTLVRGNDD